MLSELDCPPNVDGILVNLQVFTYSLNRQQQSSCRKLGMCLQIAAVYDMMGDPHSALEWFERLNLRVPQDPGVLARLGAIHARYTFTAVVNSR